MNDLEATTTELEATTADLEATTSTLTEGLAAVEATVDDLATASDARDPGGETGQGSWSHRQPIHAGSERGREHSGGADTRPSPRSNPDRGRDRPDEPASPDGGERAMGPDASGCCEAVTRGCHETDHGERGHDTGDAGVDTAVSGWGRDPGTDATDETPLADHQAGHPRGPGTGRGRAGQPDANWSDPGEERSLLARLRERL